ncbi:hypothetical protein E4099_19070 [Streptomyces palmae]|uniref:Uncharacterized protein n=1 Tax=Streptomyces palmae TaxID=1701085 RepID=A0A4Z0H9X1_9ACTN|nr:hypothetical protein E4099_19070 [Streptomyces palmae]
MWTKDHFLWRTSPILCTTRGTVLWTSPHSPQDHPSDLRVLHPQAVGKKNFPSRPKIATNGTEKIVPGRSM